MYSTNICSCKGRTHVCAHFNGLTRWSVDKGIWVWHKKGIEGLTYVVFVKHIKNKGEHYV